jgi:hypothetical protein
MTLHEIKTVLGKFKKQKIGVGEFEEGYRAGVMFALSLLEVLDTSSKQESKYNNDDDTYL